MPCCLLIVALFLPRFALVIMFLTGYVQWAFQGWLLPLFGLIFMPYTTCAYAIGMNEAGSIHGWSLVLLIIGVMLDVGGHGGTAARTRVHREK